MEKVTLQPAAGAHGELTGLMIIKAYHKNNGDNERKKIIIRIQHMVQILHLQHLQVLKLYR